MDTSSFATTIASMRHAREGVAVAICVIMVQLIAGCATPQLRQCGGEVAVISHADQSIPVWEAKGFRYAGGAIGWGLNSMNEIAPYVIQQKCATPLTDPREIGSIVSSRLRGLDPANEPNDLALTLAVLLRGSGACILDSAFRARNSPPEWIAKNERDRAITKLLNSYCRDVVFDGETLLFTSVSGLGAVDLWEIEFRVQREQWYIVKINCTRLGKKPAYLGFLPIF
jgi:hypothetical protein